MAKVRMAINGFGRTGRCSFRAAMLDKEFCGLIEVVAVNAGEPKTLAHLLKYDSTYGKFACPVEVSGDSIVVDGNRVKVMNERDLAKMDWRGSGVQIVLESTGRFESRKDAQKHLDSGAKKVLISAPAREPDVTIVPAVNDATYDSAKHNIISLASCTTNCLAPVSKILNDTFGIETGYMTTCHAYTMTQRLLDGAEDDLRRARSAAVNIVPTSTGAARSIGIVVPELEGKMDGMALRVPVPTGSMVDLAVVLKKDVTKEDINAAFKSSAEGRYKGIVQYSEEPLVSTDIIGNPHSAIVDGPLTSVVGKKGKFAKVYAWYDNEWGYSSRLKDFLKTIAKKMP